MHHAFAIAFAVLIGLLCLFQLALALGAPWGKLAWGGQHIGKLPAGFRVGSVAGILVYSCFAALALDRAGIIDIVPDIVSQVGMWIEFGLLAVGTLMNLVSRSKPERYTMTPVALVLTILALIIAIQGPGAEQKNWAQDRPVGTFTVIDDGTGAKLCTDAVMESYPPQCQGQLIDGWDWESVASYEEEGDVRWGEYDLTVIPDGDRVRVIIAETVEGTEDNTNDQGIIDGRPMVTWIEDGKNFEVVTYGSSSCPTLVIAVESTRPDQVVLRLAQSGGEACTADFGPATQEVTLPETVTERPVSVLLDDTQHDTLAKLTLQ